jgi:hypothetical protein
MKILKEFNAEGQGGFLLIYPDISTGKPVEKMIAGKKRKVIECDNIVVSFRIYEYDENGKHKRDEKGCTIFKDYDIRHHDLKIKLLDGHFYETDEGNFIDYPGLEHYKNASER